MSGEMRAWIRQERDRLARAKLTELGYVLDYFIVYRASFLDPSGKRPAVRGVARGSSRRLHAERLARMFGARR